jgi:hypothetical protein
LIALGNGKLLGLVKTILDDPITVPRVLGKRRGVETVWAHDDPERFIRSLYLQYHGGYFRAMKPVEI